MSAERPAEVTTALTTKEIHAWDTEAAASATALTGWVSARLAAHEAALAALKAVEGSRTPNNTLRLYDVAIEQLNLAGAQAGILNSVAEVKEVRDQARTEAQHVIHMVPALDPEDEQIVARMMHMPVRELDRQLAEAAEISPDPEGRFSAVWYDRRAGETRILPPLPAEVRSQILVRRAVDLDAHEPATDPDDRVER